MSKAPALPGKMVDIRAERRNLTVLFADLVGSSALANRLDPEDLRVILRSVQAAFRDAIDRYGGHIGRYLGDGVLAYFGYPAAHEDAAERAVNAALRMIESVSALSFPQTPPLQLHIGIATGLVVVGDMIGEGENRELELIGEAPNLAAWLQQHAKPNEILVSSRTQRLLGGLFELADLGEVQAKGHKQPERVWRVLRPGAIRSRFDARRSSQLTEFVGREAELAVLHREFERTRGGEGRFVTISGEPGMGKSRLIAAFRERLAPDTFRTLLFQCSSYHTSSPWHPIIRHLEDAAGISHDSAPAAKLRLLEDLIDRHLPRQRDEAVPLLAALLSIPADGRYPASDLTPPQRKRRTFLSLLDLLRAQAEQQPAIVIFEDVHWIDPSSLELLERFRNEARGKRILTIATFRSKFEPAWKDQPDTAILINPLEPAQSARLVTSLAHGRALPASVVEQIVRKTDGVPLFIEEVAKTVLQDLADSTGAGASEPRSLPAVPETLHDSLMVRVDQTAPMKEIAQISAAIGREFALNLLQAIAPHGGDEVRDAIDRLVEAGLLFQQKRRATETYAFKHALVQDAAYASMLRDQRRALHIRIAEALGQRFSDIAETSPELVAHHYTQAHETRLATTYWFKAGRKASSRSAFIEASTHFESALRLLGHLPESPERDALELQLQQSLGSALIAAKGFGAEETTQAFKRALQLCEKCQDSAHTFAVLNGLVGVYYMRGDFEQSRSTAEDLLARALHQRDTTGLLMGHRVLGMSLFALGELAEARRHLEAALELYKAPLHAPLALVFSHDFKATAEVYLGLTLALQGDVERGLAHGREALAYAEQLRQPHSICYVLPFVAGALLVSGRPAAAHPIAERTIALSAEYGFPQWVAGGLLLRGWARLELGQIEIGIADIRSSISGLEASGTLVWMQFARFLLALGLAKAEQASAALELVDDILGEIRATGGRWYEAELHRLRGELLRSVGRPRAEVEPCFDAAAAVAKRQGSRLWQRQAEDAFPALLRAEGETPTPSGGTASVDLSNVPPSS